MQEIQKKRPDFKSAAIKRKLIVLSDAEILGHRVLREGRSLPLGVEPKIADVDLVDWSSANRETVTQWLHKHGAILFRGFMMDDPSRFEQFAKSICEGPLFQENGEHPRQSIAGDVYTPVFYPRDQFLL